jgi:hypothetical protein
MLPNGSTCRLEDMKYKQTRNWNAKEDRDLIELLENNKFNIFGSDFEWVDNNWYLVSLVLCKDELDIKRRWKSSIGKQGLKERLDTLQNKVRELMTQEAIRHMFIYYFHCFRTTIIDMSMRAKPELKPRERSLLFRGSLQ